MTTVISVPSYHYVVNDVDHQGTRISYSSFFETIDAAVKEDGTVRIAYDPEAPDRSVVYPGIRWGAFAFDALLRACGAAVAVYLAWLVRQSRRGRPRPAL